LKKYFRLFKINLIDRLTYVNEILISIFTGLLVFAGQAVFWRMIYGENQILGDFTYPQIMLYFLFGRILSKFVDSEIGVKLSDSINNGSINPLIIKPLSLRLWLYINEFAIGIIDTIIKFSSFILIYLLIFQSFDITFSKIPLFLISTTISALLSYTIFFIAGLFAFKTANSPSVNQMIRRSIQFLSGLLIPYTFFPEIFQKVLKFLPFQYLFFTPVSILFGKISNDEFIVSLIIQSSWLIFLWLISSYLQNKLIKSSESVGI